MQLVAATGSRPLVAAFRAVQVQLGPVRRLEVAVLGDLAGETAGLLEEDATRAERLSALRQFHALRIREAERLSALLEASVARR
ncbi:hypothetical protein [Phenylobacterium sp. J367]|uniref:hypothetical protein n=1 Tax=Phenylobacterium sp. J367 TaxID=2898435 RepID=UPI00215117BD|nr:hypothetical protein [Phenylobacterium sp. J367]MCR5879454.1 hypothetical protein [Phenylobacterium sp. J367]